MSKKTRDFNNFGGNRIMGENWEEKGDDEKNR